jgi:transcriptional regulator with XRE-family HTH domain
MSTLAKRITARRKELGLSASDLANICGISPAAVFKWESGGTSNLKHDHLFMLADALNVRPRWLALGEGEKLAAPPMEAYGAALRRRDDTKDATARGVWERIAARFAKAAMVMILTLPPFQSDAATTSHNILSASFDLTLYTLSGLRRWLSKLVRIQSIRIARFAA